ncbi:unnamed protein product [Oncorhynchus mykiss]|uniref:Uncharacterized protein n=1 Tax=Oncorhynchus mykiss TaxID=8022 RepID=A0A060ZW45_ONCMY|nr:unnamed protein product [Oncorhynchus mykiss]
MSGDWDEDHLCKKALTLVEELCLHSSAKDSHEASCRDFVYMMRGQQHETGNNIVTYTNIQESFTYTNIQ